MLLVLAIVIAAVPVGIAVARWWVVPLPALLVLVWTLVAAVRGGDETVDDTSAWVDPLFYGGFVAVLCAVGLSMGVVWGQWLRYKRNEQRRALPR